MNPKEWTKHSLNVAHLARKIAQRAGLDEEKAYIFGLLHDIGRRKGTMQARHAIEGYQFMRDQCPEVARILQGFMIRGIAVRKN